MFLKSEVTCNVLAYAQALLRRAHLSIKKMFLKSDKGIAFVGFFFFFFQKIKIKGLVSFCLTL